MSIHSFFFKEGSVIKELKHMNNTNISYSETVIVKDNYFNWEMIHLKIIQRYVKLYSDIYIDGDDYNAVICHGKIMSLYDLMSSKWKSHIILDHEISFLFFMNW